MAQDSQSQSNAIDKVQLFENQKIRTAWVEDKQEWYLSIVDVVSVLTEQKLQEVPVIIGQS